MQYCNCDLLRSLLKGLFVCIRNKYFLVVLSIFLFGCIINYQINAKLTKTAKLLQLNYILDEISTFSKENVELEKSFYNMKWNLSNSTNTHIKTPSIPSSKYENLRRQVLNTVKEFWNFIKNQINESNKQIGKKQTTEKKLLDRILSLGVQHKRYLCNSLTNLSMVDGYSTWRSEESTNLTNLIQERLRYIQNPRNCTEAKKILCQLQEFDCGFGCAFHHVISCLIIAYELKRTLVLNTDKWNYDSAGWKKYFEPISNSCVSWQKKSVNWPGNNNAEVIHLPIITNLKPYPSYLPMAVPSDIQFRLERLHGNPSAWWIGQLATYLFNLTNSTHSFIEDYKKKIGYKKPFVGVHIRRTDKYREAKFHNLLEYMEQVDEYYNEVIGNKTRKRRIYLATDEPAVINEAKKKYSHYKVLSNDINFIKGKRFNPNSLKGLLIDIYFLLNADFLVCTFSSNICRLAYELKQFQFPDASDSFTSLDKYFYYGGINETITYIATGSYKSNNSLHLELHPEDRILTEDNYWNGYSNGTNLVSKKNGIFPSFKAKVFCRSYNFSSYDNVG